MTTGSHSMPVFRLTITRRPGRTGRMFLAITDLLIIGSKGIRIGGHVDPLPAEARPETAPSSSQ
jgi:hypothetical protein